MHPHSICYSSVASSHRQASMLAHVLCRQLGYMTYTNRFTELIELEKDHNQLRMDNIQCIGHEQALSNCQWDKVYFGDCMQVMAVECSFCSGTIEASEGVVTSPGYPFAYPFTVLCEWTIVVPENHDITLIVRQFDLPQGKTTLDCDGGNDPYVEITYGSGNSLTVKRFCALTDFKSMKLNHRTLKIKFYSGIFDSKLHDGQKKYGFNVLFRAERAAEPSNQPMKIFVISGCFIIFFALVMSCYCCRRWGEGSSRTSEDDQDLPSQCILQFNNNHVQQIIPSHLMKVNDENAPPKRNGPGRCSNVSVHPQEISDYIPPAAERQNTSMQFYPSDGTPCAVPELACPIATNKKDRSKRFEKSNVRKPLMTKYMLGESIVDTTPVFQQAKDFIKSGITFKIYRSSSPSLKESKATPVARLKEDSPYLDHNGNISPNFQQRSADENVSPNQMLSPPAKIPSIVVECVDDV